ncbi:MAG: hypothetical protein P4L40_22465 [Terracidiphilus sp.]|nr:hypothetical protein [Terracidiphilus sp.]
MPPTKPVPDVEFSAPAPDPVQTREQLNRLLAHPLFANSKRYPALLAYVVEQTLLGHSSELKERSIAVEVFGRDPSYDANADPVVRITAGEVRKRLSQYYYDPSHTGELVVELPLGSYVPAFRVPETPASSLPLSAETETSPLEVRPEPARRRWLPFAVGAAVLLTGAIGVGLGLHYRSEMPPPPPSSMERFWAPVLASSGSTTFCLGEPAKNLDSASIDDFNAPPPEPTPQKLYVRLQYSGNLALADVITLTRTVAALESHHKSFRVVPASDATFSELREGPIVLIGAFDNIWTLRVTQKLRFGFASRDGVALLVDRKSPQPTSWATAWDLPYEKLSRDYAIVARIHDETTGQPVIIAAGISEEGTEAAGEILYNPVYLDSLVAHLPAGWEDKNVEAVIETQVIQGHSGPPNILAVETW